LWLVVVFLSFFRVCPALCYYDGLRAAHHLVGRIAGWWQLHAVALSLLLAFSRRHCPAVLLCMLVAQLDFPWLCALVWWGLCVAAARECCCPSLLLSQCWDGVGGSREVLACVCACLQQLVLVLVACLHVQRAEDHAEACGCGCLAPACRAFKRQHVWSSTCVRFASMRHTALSVVQYMLSIASAFTAL